MLREAAVKSNETVELLVETAITHELESRRLGKLEIPNRWGPLLTQRFLECVPTPVVIKDREAKILWCNFSYEDLLGRPLGALVGRRITELGLME
jgi:PAS domain-containing protein